uniref:Actin-like protein n=1 Tax=Aureoumbra lagunensis TaxID=44058 RepID=A0A7S3JWI3_9STRA
MRKRTRCTMDEVTAPTYMAASGPNASRGKSWLLPGIGLLCPCLRPRPAYLTDDSCEKLKETCEDDVENPTIRATAIVAHEPVSLSLMESPCSTRSKDDLCKNKTIYFKEKVDNKKEEIHHHIGTTASPLVIDLGSAFIRIGSADETTPWCVRSQMCRPKSTLPKDVRLELESSCSWPVLACETQVPEGLLDIRDLASAEHIDDLDGLDAMTRTLLTGQEVALVAAPLGFGAPSTINKTPFASFASTFLEIAFEGVSELGALSVVGALPLPFYGLGMTSGLGLISGHQRSVITTVTDGLVKDANFFNTKNSTTTNTVLPDGTRIQDKEDAQVSNIFFAPEVFYSEEQVENRRRRTLIHCLTDQVCKRMKRPADDTPLIIAGGSTLQSGYVDALSQQLLPAVNEKLGHRHSERFALHPVDDDCISWRGASILATADEFAAWVMRSDYFELGAHRAASHFVF